MKISLGPRTILYPTPVLIVGTYDEDEKPNIMNAAWGGLCCSQPPCIAVSIRKQRHTYAGLIKHQAFTINIPASRQVKEADFAGIYSGAQQDKFAETGLTAVRAQRVNAPYVEEFPLVLECRLRHTIELGTHTQFIGEILDVKADEAVLGENNLPEIEKVDPMLFAPMEQAYYRVGNFVAPAFSVGRRS